MHISKTALVAACFATGAVVPGVASAEIFFDDFENYDVSRWYNADGTHSPTGDLLTEQNPAYEIMPGRFPGNGGQVTYNVQFNGEGKPRAGSSQALSGSNKYKAEDDLAPDGNYYPDTLSALYIQTNVNFGLTGSEDTFIVQYSYFSRDSWDGAFAGLGVNTLRFRPGTGSDAHWTFTDAEGNVTMSADGILAPRNTWVDVRALYNPAADTASLLTRTYDDEGNLVGDWTPVESMQDLTVNMAEGGWAELDTLYLQEGSSAYFKRQIDDVYVAVPEPTSILLAGVGGLAMLARRRKA